MSARASETIHTMQRVLADLAAGRTASCYLIAGEEPFFVRYLSARLLAALKEQHRTEHVQRFYGDHDGLSAAEGGFGSLMAALSTRGTLFTPGPGIVWVTMADQLFNPRSLRKGGDAGAGEVRGKAKEMAAYAGTLAKKIALLDGNRCVLVLSGSSVPPAGSEVLAACRTHGEVALFSPFKEYETAQIRTVLHGYVLKPLGKTIGDQALSVLIRQVGVSLTALAAELEKLACYAAERTEITENDVRTVALQRSDALVYAFQDSFGERDPDAFARYVDTFTLQGNTVSWLVNKLHRRLAQMNEAALPAARSRTARIAGEEDVFVRSLYDMHPTFVKRVVRQSGTFTREERERASRLLCEVVYDERRGDVNARERLRVEFSTLLAGKER